MKISKTKVKKIRYFPFRSIQFFTSKWRIIKNRTHFSQLLVKENVRVLILNIQHKKLSLEGEKATQLT